MLLLLCCCYCVNKEADPIISENVEKKFLGIVRYSVTEGRSMEEREHMLTCYNNVGIKKFIEIAKGVVISGTTW